MAYTAKYEPNNQALRINLTEDEDVEIESYDEYINGQYNGTYIRINGAFVFKSNGHSITTDEVEVLLIFGDKGDNVINLTKYTNKETATFVDGKEGNDVIIGNNAGGIFRGGEGNDVITVEGGTNDVNGGNGNDLIIDNGGYNKLNGGGGNDKIITKTKKSTGNLYKPEANFNLINSTNQLNTDDSLFTVISDSLGIDTLQINSTDYGVKIDLDLLNEIQVISESNDTLVLSTSFEYVIGTEFDDAFHVIPSEFERTIDGGGDVDNDSLYFYDITGTAQNNGSSLTIDGLMPINFTSFEDISIINVSVNTPVDFFK